MTTDLKAIEERAALLMAQSPIEEFDPRIYAMLELIEGLAQEAQRIRNRIEDDKQAWKNVL